MGKSFIAANIGALIAKRGYRVVLVDLDLGGPNMHTFLGLKNPSGGINSYLNKTVESLALAADPTPLPNLFCISSTHCSTEISNLHHAQKIKLIRAIKALSFDVIILDLGAGTSFNTLDFFLMSDRGVFVCTPEPTSIENAFRFIKAAYLRRIKKIIKLNSFRKILGETAPGSTDTIDRVLKHDPKREPLLRESIRRFQFGFVINQFRKTADPQLGQKMEKVCNRHFYSKFNFLGSLNYDDRVSESIFRRTLFTLQHPDASASQVLNNICEKLLHGTMEDGENRRCNEDL